MLWPIVTFVLLLALTWWITKHVQGIGYLLTGDGQVALVVYWLLIWPGVLLHELSHAITAWLLGVRGRRFSLGLGRARGRRRVSLGAVTIATTDPLRASLIGLAPLIAGCGAILLIGSCVFGLRWPTAFSWQWLWRQVRVAYAAPDFWLWAYLVFAIGNAMLPSAADRRAWGAALLLALFVGALFYFSGLIRPLAGTLGQWLRAALSRLTYAFAMTVVIDVVFAVVIFVVEQIMALLGLGRLEYG